MLRLTQTSGPGEHRLERPLNLYWMAAVTVISPRLVMRKA